MHALACIPVDWDQAIAAVVAAAVAVSGTLAAKHRPAGARTREEDHQEQDLETPWLDDLLVWDTPQTTEPLAGWPPVRARSRLRRAADELRGRPG